MGRHLLIALVLALCGAESSWAVFLDLRGLPAQANSTSAGGIAMSWTTPRAGTFTSTATRFGFNSTGAGDSVDLIDGGAGAAELVHFIFETPVFVDSIVISQFGAGDAGTFTIQSTPPTPPIVLANGVNNLGGAIAAAHTTHSVAWTGANTAGLGFSIDGFNVRPLAPFSADFNLDEQVNGADLLTWQRGLGPFSLPALGNANFDDRVDGLDLEVWRLQYGGASGVVQGVPEPMAAGLLGCGLALVGVGWRRRVM
jgi:hypothetical protein